jgi:hypothetical protein
LGVNLANIILIAVVLFLAVNIGFSLYQPDKGEAIIPSAVLKIIRGDIQVQTKNSVTWEKATESMVLEPGSRVRTTADSLATINFAEGTTTKLEPGTDVIVNKLENNEANQLTGIMLKQQSGVTWNQVTRLEDNSYHFQIQTPSAEVKVRGTLFTTAVDKSGKTTVSTTQGLVNINAAGEEVDIPAGQQTTIERGQPPATPELTPPPSDEIVLTINKEAFGLVTDPYGSSTGIQPDGQGINEIGGSQSVTGEDATQTIRIPEPYAGEYTLTLHGLEDGPTTVQVEGAADGVETVSFTESCNVTTNNNLILKLHMDILNGLLGKTNDSEKAAKNQSADTAKADSPAPQPSMDNNSDQGKGEGTNETRFTVGGVNFSNQWLIIGVFVVILAGILIIAWKKL